MNFVTLVGRLTVNPTIEETEGVKTSRITLAVPRTFKNDEGIFETDFIPVTLHNNLAVQTCNYVKKGDVVGIKGMLEKIDGQELHILADKVTFLSSKKLEEVKEGN